MTVLVFSNQKKVKDAFAPSSAPEATGVNFFSFPSWRVR